MMIGAFFMLNTNVMAQANEAGESVSYTLPSMAVLDIEGTAPSLTFTAPTAGSSVAAVTSSESWINYSSVVEVLSTNKVTVSISAGTVPISTTLKVSAAPDAGNGNGAVGTPSSQLTLSGVAQDIITNIGSCYTGDGANSGHQLIYEWSVDADGYSNLVSTSGNDITVTYTITATI